MGFFSELKSDLSTTEGTVDQETISAESVDLESMLNNAEDALKEAEKTESSAEPVTTPEEVAVVPEDATGEAGEGEDDFLSKLSQALNENESPAAASVVAPSAFAQTPEAEPAMQMPVEEAQAPASEPMGQLDFGSSQTFAFTQPETTTAFAQEESFTMEMNTQPTDENAVITGGMTVNGDVGTSGNLELMGKVTGNVRVNGKLTVSGEINGDSSAAEVYAENARINGDVHSGGSVKVGQSTVIIGNIIANGAVIAGAVKGDIDVHGPVILDTTAIVMGNIKSQSVQINNGAVIEGMCSQAYAEVNPSAFFDNLKGGERIEG